MDTHNTTHALTHLQRPAVRDAMTHTLNHARAHALGELAVVQARGVRVIFDDEPVKQTCCSEHEIEWPAVLQARGVRVIVDDEPVKQNTWLRARDQLACRASSARAMRCCQ
jgi:hypothetical protein